MSISGYLLGFDPDDLIIKGKTNDPRVVVPGLTVADVASAEFILADQEPTGANSPQVLVTKTTDSGIVLTDDAAGLFFDIALDSDDTADIDGFDFFFRLDYDHTNGAEYESVRGLLRLSPRV